MMNYEETLYDYLVSQKAEREAIVAEYNKAKELYEIAKAKYESYGDITAVEHEIDKLEKFIAQVKQEPVGEIQVASTEEEEVHEQVITVTCNSSI